MELRRVSDSQLEMIYLIRPEHLNGAGRLFGGKLVEWMDELSALVAIRHCRKDVTTVAIDNLRFMCPAYQRDMVVFNRKNHACGNDIHGGACGCLY